MPSIRELGAEACSAGRLSTPRRPTTLARRLPATTAAFRQLSVMRADSLDALTAGYNPDGTRVVTGGSGGKAIVWDTRPGSHSTNSAAT